MKKTIKLALSTALALGATSAFATNGDLMIGQGAKSRAMGGVGIAKAFGAESAIANPANISSTEKSEATLAVTVFMPNVSFKSGFGGATGDYVNSGANLSVIPELYYSTRLSDKLVVGLAIAGTAGMGTDYDSDKNAGFGVSGTARMKTELALMKIVVPISYSIDSLTVGIAPVLQYGTLQLSHLWADGITPTFLDNGQSSDIGYGFEFGATYEMSALGAKGLTLGAVYKSEIAMTYDNTISDSMAKFGVSDDITSGDNITQPSERGVGISYAMGSSTISADYKNIAWGDAEGYADFGWENQDVYAVGYEHAAKSWALRLGYNYAKSPIIEQTDGGTTDKASAQNFFNLAGFPGIVETHYTIGGGYTVSDALTLDGSFIYVPETTKTFDVSGYGAGTASVKHSQMGLTIAGTYKF